MKRSFLFPLLIISIGCFAQKQLETHFIMNLGATGWGADSTEISPIGQTTFSENLNFDFSIGTKERFFFKENRQWSFDLGLIYNYGQFFTEEVGYTEVGPGVINFEITNQISSQKLLVPSVINFHSNKWTIQAGVLTTFPLRSKLVYHSEYTGTSGAQTIHFERVTGKDERINHGGNFDHHKTYHEKFVEWQAQFGLEYYISRKWHLNLNHRTYLAYNQLIREILEYDVIGSYKRKHAFRGMVFSMGLGYKL